ncbi:bacillithiol system redox-active protein YtxJ [Halobacillus mangrovi]|uniref:bacillithiol system redox-active protein YtxJ n=1 Tax=Halobacillus mangrovi TaxID=402384 RepID=UPI003D96B914
MNQQVLYSEDEFNNLLKTKEEFFLLKHSLTCPISAAARSEYEKFQSTASVPCYILHVQESRQLSNSIAKEFQVRHESPQALLFKNGKVVWHDSHGSITESRLRTFVE